MPWGHHSSELTEFMWNGTSPFSHSLARSISLSLPPSLLSLSLALSLSLPSSLFTFYLSRSRSSCGTVRPLSKPLEIVPETFVPQLDDCPKKTLSTGVKSPWNFGTRLGSTCRANTAGSFAGMGSNTGFSP